MRVRDHGSPAWAAQAGNHPARHTSSTQSQGCRAVKESRVPISMPRMLSPDRRRHARQPNQPFSRRIVAGNGAGTAINDQGIEGCVAAGLPVRAAVRPRWLGASSSTVHGQERQVRRWRPGRERPSNSSRIANLVRARRVPSGCRSCGDAPTSFVTKVALTGTDRRFDGGLKWAALRSLDKYSTKGVDLQPALQRTT